MHTKEDPEVTKFDLSVVAGMIMLYPKAIGSWFIWFTSTTYYYINSFFSDKVR